MSTVEEIARGANTENPFGAQRLYESSGYREVRRFTHFNRAMQPKRSER